MMYVQMILIFAWGLLFIMIQLVERNFQSIRQKEAIIDMQKDEATIPCMISDVYGLCIALYR